MTKLESFTLRVTGINGYAHSYAHKPPPTLTPTNRPAHFNAHKPPTRDSVALSAVKFCSAHMPSTLTPTNRLSSLFQQCATPLLTPTNRPKLGLFQQCATPTRTPTNRPKLWPHKPPKAVAPIKSHAHPIAHKPPKTVAPTVLTLKIKNIYTLWGRKRFLLPVTGRKRFLLPVTFRRI